MFTFANIQKFNEPSSAFFFTGIVTLLVILCGCSSTPKLQPPPPVCVKYDTTEVLFNYGPATVREQTIPDLVKRIDRYFTENLKVKNIKVSKGTCNSSVDAILNVRLDTLESLASKKTSPFSFTAIITHVRVKYVATFVSPSGTELFEFDDDPDTEGLDELAEIIASKLYKHVARYY